MGSLLLDVVDGVVVVVVGGNVVEADVVGCVVDCRESEPRRLERLVVVVGGVVVGGVEVGSDDVAGVVDCCAGPA